MICISHQIWRWGGGLCRGFCTNPRVRKNLNKIMSPSETKDRSRSSVYFHFIPGRYSLGKRPNKLLSYLLPSILYHHFHMKSSFCQVANGIIIKTPFPELCGRAWSHEQNLYFIKISRTQWKLSLCCILLVSKKLKSQSVKLLCQASGGQQQR
jgi:hypothetical protein